MESTYKAPSHDGELTEKGISNFLKSVCDNVTHSTESLTKEIREKPLQSTVIALGVGYMLSALLNR
jgi:ElaB/YqjD/DUF883 family membrane-anchored ribosome-binding protein